MESPARCHPGYEARRFRARVALALANVFDERAARDEDVRAMAAELEEHREFIREYDAWLDGVRDEMPVYPTPETLHSHAIPTRS